MPRTHTNSIAVIVAMLLAGSGWAQGNHEKHAHSFTKDVDAFHEVLAPLWHAKAGKARSQKVCAQTDKLATLARDISGGDTKPLVESIATLKEQCQAGPTRIDAAFAKVHEAFHRLDQHEEH